MPILDPTVVPKLFVLSIGIDKYVNIKYFSTQCCKSDAVQVATAFKSLEPRARIADVTVLQDEQANKKTHI